MLNTRKQDVLDRNKHLEIPNLCRNSNVLAIILVTQATVIVAWLLGINGFQWNVLGLWSLYSQWVVLLATFFLCLCRHQIAKLPYGLGCLLILLICSAALLVVELVTGLWITGFTQWNVDLNRLFRLLIVTLFISFGLLRFFAFLAALEHHNQAEAQSRIEALQSRIQPHFLFNSLNTISELTVSEPEQAEQAIHSLSMLFRASLENEQKQHSLESELNLCRRYIELETWRLSDRLTIDWHLGINNEKEWGVPKLLIQPLIENAIVHGQQINGKIEISIDLRESSKHLSLMIENTKSADVQNVSKGHGIALNNIRERLQVLYDDQQTLRVKETDTSYSVLVRIPKHKALKDILT